MKNARYDWKRGVLPMELITRSRERRRIAIIVVALVLALLIALAYTIVSSRQATAAAVETMSEVGRVPNRGVSGPSPENRRHPCEVNLSLRPPSGQWRSL